MTEQPEVPEPPDVIPPPEDGPDLDPAGAEDDELQNEPVHVDNQMPTDPPGNV
jgi:hypothetical protein